MLADPVPADPVPSDPKLAEPVLPDPVLADPVVPDDPVVPEPVVPDDPVVPDPVLVPSAGGVVVSAGLVPVPPPAGGLVGGDTVVEELPPAGGVAVVWGLAVLDGCAELVDGQGDRVAAAVCWPFVALLLAFAEAVELAPPVAPDVALAVPVTVTVTVFVAVAVALPLGLLLVLPLGGLLAELAGGALGVTDAAAADGLAWACDGEPDGHAITGTPLWAAELPPWPVPVADPAPWVADPFRVGAPPLALELEIPTAVPSWTKAWRSGGTASATPMANTAQAAARAGRSSPYRHSRRCRSPASAACCPPRATFQRRVRAARKPTRAAECRLAWAGPELIRARIRSSPSGRGSS